MTSTIKANETLTGYDLAELLSGEAGLFEATSPAGEQFQVVCRAGSSIANLRPAPAGKNQQKNAPWRVRKIGELRSEEQSA